MKTHTSPQPLVWRLLRAHISPLQLAAYTLANLVGIFIILLAFQLYRDLSPLLTQPDGIFSPQYLILNKHLTASDALGLGSDPTFSQDEIDDLRRQPFTLRIAPFTASRYDVTCTLSGQGLPPISTDMFFESVPDSFIDTDLTRWHFDPRQPVVPIILPRSYLTLYNFGFAQTHALPKVSENLATMINLNITLRGNHRQETLQGRVVGFTTRLNTILVPDDFIQWSNQRYTQDTDTPRPTRLILQTDNPADPQLAQYLDLHHYETADETATTSRAILILRLLTTLVIAVGTIVSLLSIYLLILSIHLLIQKNTQKIQTLRLLGHTARSLARPYQTLVILLNILVLILALALLISLRSHLLHQLQPLFPQTAPRSLLPTILLALLITLILTYINIRQIKNKIH